MLQEPLSGRLYVGSTRSLCYSSNTGGVSPHHTSPWSAGESGSSWARAGGSSVDCVEPGPPGMWRSRCGHGRRDLHDSLSFNLCPLRRLGTENTFVLPQDQEPALRHVQYNTCHMSLYVDSFVYFVFFVCQFLYCLLLFV